MSDKIEYLRDREDSKIGKIVVDRDFCIAASSCIVVTPETYELDGESKAVVTDANAADDETLKTSAESCPTKAILLFDKEGNQIYP